MWSFDANLGQNWAWVIKIMLAHKNMFKVLQLPRITHENYSTEHSDEYSTLTLCEIISNQQKFSPNLTFYQWLV